VNIKITKRYNKQKVMATKPTLMGVVIGIKFYEHPVFGDEVPLIADTDKQFGLSEFWEIPPLIELI